MKIRTRLQLGALLPIVAAIVACLLATGGMYCVVRSVQGHELFTESVFVLFGLAALFVGGAFYEVGTHLARRISALEAAALNVRAGQLEWLVDTEAEDGHDELTGISSVFNEMVGDLRDYVKLVPVHRQLERECADAKRAAALLRRADVDVSDSLERLQRAQEQLLRTERMGTLGRMFSGFSHDLSQRLMTIQGASELELARSEGLDDCARQDFETIQNAAREMSEEFGRFATFCRLPHASREAIDLDVLVAEAVALAGPKLKAEAVVRGCDIQVQNDCRLPITVWGCTLDLLQVLTSLIDNASEAMCEDGTITLSAEKRDGRAVLAVSDTGMGMNEGVKNRCCRPFFSTKSNAAGIGMAVAAGIVRQHEGKFGVISEPGHGTTVYVELPLVADRESGAADSASVSAVPARLLSVLLVEDDPWVVDVVVRGLVAAGHTVTVGRDGRDGLEKFKAGKVDLVLTDRAMPEMSGYELADAVKRIDPKVPVVLLSGFGQIMEDTEQRPPSIDKVIGKPVSLAKLNQVLAEVASANL